jgi:hypothetical protein
MRAFGRWVLLLLTVASALAVAYGAYGMADQAWSGVVDYRSPYVESRLETTTPGSPESGRVVMVIVDGLTLDASRQMSSLQSLRSYGSDYVAHAGQPSLSYPNWTTLLTGTTQDYHGVVTNWHEGPAPLETLLDTARASETTFVVVGPSDIATLFPAARGAQATYFEPWSDSYLSARYIDKTLELTAKVAPRFVLLHLPDVDEAGHAYGSASQEYARTVARVDGDLRRLVEGLQDGHTSFVIVADHGHIATGGHGGWEPIVTQVPAVFSSGGVRVSGGEMRQADVAPTVAVLAGLPVPRGATGQPIVSILPTASAADVRRARLARIAAVNAYAERITAPVGLSVGAPLSDVATPGAISARLEAARSMRESFDRSARLRGPGPWIAVACLVVLVYAAAASWRAFAASLAGAIAYYLSYNLMFFGVHRYLWSLSAFNSEDRVKAWMNGRLLEAAIAGLLGALVAGIVYPLLRDAPKGSRGRYLAGWLTLGPLTILVTQATLGLQVAWFLWWWGLTPVWRLPDLMWGFKFDLDLVQVTALGAAAVLAPLVTFLVGRYHPRVRLREGKTAERASG